MNVANMKRLYVEPLYNFVSNKDEYRIFNTLLLNRQRLSAYLDEHLAEPAVRERLMSWFKSADANHFLLSRSELSQSTIRAELDDTVSILALSYAIYDARSRNREMPSREVKSMVRNSNVSVDAISKQIQRSTWLTGSANPMKFDDGWERFSRANLWFNYLDIINEKTRIKDQWRKRIHTAGILFGKSQRTFDYSFAFLLNMMALEVILTNRDDRRSEAIANRVGLIIGQTDHWQQSELVSTMKYYYGKRCSLVHDGSTSDVTIKDLVVVDEILFNVMKNIVQSPDLFRDINDIKRLAALSDAYELVRKEIPLEMTILPKFSYVRREYTEEELQSLEGPGEI